MNFWKSSTGEMKEEGVKEVMVESLEEMSGEVAFPWSSWGLQLPPASPPFSTLSPTWRPWEQRPKKLKKRSPTSEARSLRRLLEWQQQRDLQRASPQLTRECSSSSTPLPPARELKQVRLLDRLETEQGGKSGSQAFPSSQWSGSQISSAFPSWSGSQTSPTSSSWSGSQTSPASSSLSGSQTIPCLPSWSGSQTAPCSSPWSGSRTIPPSSPWSDNQGGVHQDNWLPAGNLTNQTMLQQSFSPLVTLPSPIPWSSPPSLPSWTGPADRCTWGTLPALVTMCPSCHAWGLMTPK